MTISLLPFPWIAMKIMQTMPHSMVLLMDYSAGDTPSSFSGGLVTFTSTCVAIGTIAEDDGVASVVVTRSPKSYIDALSQVHIGKLLVPSKRLSLVDTSNRELATMEVSTKEIDLEVWVDHPSEPERIVIGIAESGKLRSKPN